MRSWSWLRGRFKEFAGLTGMQLWSSAQAWSAAVTGKFPAEIEFSTASASRSTMTTEPLRKRDCDRQTSLSDDQHKGRASAAGLQRDCAESAAVDAAVGVVAFMMLARSCHVSGDGGHGDFVWNASNARCFDDTLSRFSSLLWLFDLRKDKWRSRQISGAIDCSGIP